MSAKHCRLERSGIPVRSPKMRVVGSYVTTFLVRRCTFFFISKLLLSDESCKMRQWVGFLPVPYLPTSSSLPPTLLLLPPHHCGTLVCRFISNNVKVKKNPHFWTKSSHALFVYDAVIEECLLELRHLTVPVQSYLSLGVPKGGASAEPPYCLEVT